MSWWVSLRDVNGNIVAVEPFEEGGTYCLGGSTEASLNITYNYGGQFHDAGIELEYKGGNIHGKQAYEVILLLQLAVAKLGTAANTNYWEATPGNAGYALAILLRWAKEHPMATFEVH